MAQPRADREARGISDSVEAKQQKDAPEFNSQLVGKWLEVCWPYKLEGKTVKIWASGKVKRIADGLLCLGAHLVAVKGDTLQYRQRAVGHGRPQRLEVADRVGALLLRLCEAVKDRRVLRLF